MQSLADYGPNNNILYPHGPPLLVNRDGHEQSVYALTHGHLVEKGDKPYTQSPAKPNRMGNRFRAYPEVTSDRDLSSEEFMHKTPGRLPMWAGWAHEDQFEWSWVRGRADELYQYDQMSDQPLPLETQFSGVANMSNGEFQGKYVHFNVIPNSGKNDHHIVSEPLVHEIAPCHIMTTPHETSLTAPQNEKHIPV